MASARQRLESSMQEMAVLESRRGTLENQREHLRQSLSLARASGADGSRGGPGNRHQVRIASLGAGLRACRASSACARSRRICSRAGKNSTRQIADGEAPLAQLAAELDERLQTRLGLEQELTAAREALEAAESAMHEINERRLSAEGAVDDARQLLEAIRMAAQELKVRRESLLEQFHATQFELETVTAEMAPDASIASLEQAVADVTGKIERLGQVNLAAIDEFKEQSERKEYLDRQFADLTDALETLETAIRKIDRETRSRFQDTFDRVNAGLKERFPRLFGGGHAYLELTGEDVLSAGVSIMARPPGKRNSTINQLSGGEKALTAVALVFSIFELNPAPFCLLDEVDAPLDDNNVGRFCETVKEMSSRVQFIFITHNKTTMEMASQLIGVTMHEPGVSRLVAVDVDTAVRMAAM